jgi:PAS domain-containing protein
MGKDSGKGDPLTAKTPELLEQAWQQAQAEIVALRAQLEQRDRADARFKRAIDQSAHVVAIIDGPDPVVRYCNPLFEKLCGHRYLTGTRLRDSIPELAGQGIVELIEGIFLSGKPFSGHAMPVEIERQGKVEPHYFTFVYQPVFDAQGAVEAVIATGLEVTDQVLAQRGAAKMTSELEERHRLIEALVTERTQELQTANARQHLQTRELAEQKAFAESIIQNVPAGVLYMDRDLFCRVVNPAYSEFLQIPIEQMVDRYIFDFLVGSESQVEPLLRGVLETGVPYTANGFPFQYITSEGKTHITYWDFVYYPVFLSGHEKPDGIVSLAQEVSGRVQKDLERELLQAKSRQLQQQKMDALEASDRMKDQFLSILSHELRTPINAVMGFASILADEVSGTQATSIHRKDSRGCRDLAGSHQ